MEGSSRGLGKRERKDNEVSAQEETAPNFVMSIAERRKTVLLSNLSLSTKIKDIIKFFEGVGTVVQVRLVINETGKNLRWGSVEFSSAEEAKKAQEMNGKRMHTRIVYVTAANISPDRPMYFIEHKVWSKYYRLPNDGTSSHFSEICVPARENTLFIANLSPQAKMKDIIKFFKRVVKHVRVRLIVNPEGKHVGFGFAEFTSANDANKALHLRNGLYMLDHKIYLEVVTASPKLKYSYKKHWYEEYLLQDYLLQETPQALAVREKTLHVYNVSNKTKMSDIIEYFKDAGKVVHVRRIVNRTGQHLPRAIVVFASANEAETALKDMKGVSLCGSSIEIVRANQREREFLAKYCIDHKVWYEDQLRREHLLIEEDEEVEELDDCSEEVAARKSTLFIKFIPKDIKMSDITNYFKGVAEVASVWLSVDYNGQNVGCAFVEFASINEAKKAKKAVVDEAKRKKLGVTSLCLRTAELSPYPIRPKYNLAEEHWRLTHSPVPIAGAGITTCDKKEADSEINPKKKKQKKNPKEKKQKKNPKKKEGLSIFNLFCGKKKTLSEDN